LTPFAASTSLSSSACCLFRAPSPFPIGFGTSLAYTSSEWDSPARDSARELQDEVEDCSRAGEWELDGHSDAGEEVPL